MWRHDVSVIISQCYSSSSRREERGCELETEWRGYTLTIMVVSHAGIVSKRLNQSPKFYRRRRCIVFSELIDIAEREQGPNGGVKHYPRWTTV